MKSEHRGLVALVLSTGVLLLWFTFFQPARQTAPTKIAEKEIVNEEKAKTGMFEAEGNVKLANKPENIPVQTTTIQNNLYTAEASNDGGIITSWRVHDYRQGTEKTSPLLDLVVGNPSLDVEFLDANFSFPQTPRYKLIEKEEASLTYLWRSTEVEVMKKLEFRPDRYAVDVTLSIQNLTDHSLQGRPFLAVRGETSVANTGGFFSFLKSPPLTNKHPILYRDGKVERFEKVQDLSQTNELPGALYWAGLEDRYFMSAIIPRVQESGISARYGAFVFPEKGEQARKLFSGIALAQKTISPQGKGEHTFSVFIGPKEIDQLHIIGARLDEAIDYGWFAVVAVPILQLLKFFYGIVHNYGLAIIFLTMFIKLLLHPISKKSMKSMKAMQELQPKLKELQEKYKSDKMRLNQETMLLFKRHKVNPAGGCLPMLLQLPIYIALYKVLWNSIELYHAPFFWFYKDLAAPDPYFIGPILLGIFMVAQQKLMPSASADPVQKKMMMLMPIMFSLFMLFLPSGLVIYILVNTVMSVLQQWMYNHDIRFRDVLRGKMPKKAA